MAGALKREGLEPPYEPWYLFISSHLELDYEYLSSVRVGRRKLVSKKPCWKNLQRSVTKVIYQW